jgi:indole-3-glycerol phosphate synthase
LKDLSAVRKAYPDLPLLRKDFIIDPYQLHEASAHGADLVLLIAAILERKEVDELVHEARSLNLSVLFEVHEEEDLEKYHLSIGFVGVNNRDLKTFRVDTSTSIRMAGRLPREAVWVSESGIGNKKDLELMHKAGYRLFLVGERFMREEDPGAALDQFMTTV